MFAFSERGLLVSPAATVGAEIRLFLVGRMAMLGVVSLSHRVGSLGRN